MPKTVSRTPLRFNIQNARALISRFKDTDRELFNALQAVLDEIKVIEDIFKTPNDVLNRYALRNLIAGAVFPSGSNPPPNPQAGEGNTFFNTSRNRHQAAVDTYDYYDFPTPESCRIYRSSDQALTNGTATAIQFTTERFDYFNLADLATNNTRITFPIDGRYLVGGNVDFEASATGRRSLGVQINGGAFICLETEMAVTTAAIATRVSVNTVYEFAAGDYVELIATQFSGGALNALASPNYSPEFWAHRLG